MKEFKGAIFDLDGTILDSMWVWEQVDVNFLGKRGIPIPSDYAKAISAMNIKTAAEYTIDRFSLPETVEDVVEEWFGMAMKEYGEELKKELWGGHLWNPSYFVATVSENTEEQIRKYIQNQKER